MARETEQPRAPRVTVFTTPSCSYCNMLKAFLRQNKVRFREVDLTRDPAAARDLLRRTGQMAVPVTEINRQLILGFDRPRISALLGIR